MTEAIVSRDGESLAICFQSEVAESIGLAEGERVEIEVWNGDILVRRQSAHVGARKQAEQAAAEIMAERKNYSLGGITARELIDEGRHH
jgi:antitoxin component of MazEF toxin-antitoxin module